MNPALLSSDDWETPPALFEEINAEFQFTLDVCAAPATAKCQRYFTIDDDGLAQAWAPAVCWMNPPYSKPEPWVRKAFAEAQRGATVVALLRVDPSTKWWAVFWDYESNGPRAPCLEVRFLPYRVRFVGATGSPNFSSAVVVMSGARPKETNG